MFCGWFIFFCYFFYVKLGVIRGLEVWEVLGVGRIKIVVFREFGGLLDF
jgi:hypothetical protein